MHGHVSLMHAHAHVKVIISVRMDEWVLASGVRRVDMVDGMVGVSRDQQQLGRKLGEKRKNEKNDHFVGGKWPK